MKMNIVSDLSRGFNKLIDLICMCTIILIYKTWCVMKQFN